MLFCNVQIPLWTIVTGRPDYEVAVLISSDSSMDDCNLKRAVNKRLISAVQIPLWTIVTSNALLALIRSDKFRFLYGRL